MLFSSAQHNALGVAYSQAASDSALSVEARDSFGRKAVWFQELAKLSAMRNPRGQSDLSPPEDNAGAGAPLPRVTPDLPLP